MAPLGKMRGCAFVEYSSPQETHLALHSLHGRQILGKELLVERSKEKPKDFDVKKTAPAVKKRRIGSGMSYGRPSFPFPKATESIVDKIGESLLLFPEFYATVLNVMNELNLPLPFERDSLSEVERGKYSLDMDDTILRDSAPKDTLDVLNSCEKMDKAALQERYPHHKTGDPSVTLYIKNLHPKKTDEDELRRIFGSFVETETQRKNLEIQVMRKGKMRGQGFVTFPDQNSSCEALKACHGIILNGKPLLMSYSKRLC